MGETKSMRLYIAVKFDSDMYEQDILPSPGGFEVTTKSGKSYEFDFYDSDGWVDREDPNTVCYCLRDEDISAFPEIEKMRKHLGEITKINECYIDTECYEDSFNPKPVKLVEFCIESTIANSKDIPNSTKFIDVENTNPGEQNDCIVLFSATDLLLETFSY